MSPPFEVTAAKITELETAVEHDPDNIDRRLALLFAYGRAGVSALFSPQTVLDRRRHILWVIQHHGDDPFAGLATFLSKQRTDSLYSVADPDGYQEARKLWLSQANSPQASATTLANAALFLEIEDKPLAESLLERAQSIQPDRIWTIRLARVYVLAILGATAEAPLLPDYAVNILPTAVSVSEAHGAFANMVRRKLDQSRDVLLLQSVGIGLIQPSRPKLDFDYFSLGKNYISRAAALNPASTAGIELTRLNSRDETLRHRQRIQQLPKDHRYEAAAALPDRDRFELFWTLARDSFYYGNSFDGMHRDEAKREWDKAARYAADLLKVAAQFRSDAAYPVAVFNSNIMLGVVAALNNDTQHSLQYLHAARKALAPSAGALPTEWKFLCSSLLAAGYQEDVIEFVENLAMTNPAQRDDYLVAAAQLRSGGLPEGFRRRIEQ